MKLAIMCCVFAFAFGCAPDGGVDEVDDQTGEEVIAESEGSIADEPATSTVENALVVCQQWFCVAVKPGTECRGYGIDSSKSRCIAEALSDCAANCGAPCMRESETCDFPP
jgi:hypothetical protein